jgi:hypothetical protein
MSELMAAQEWCDLLGARVMDPDGWRDGTRGWDEPITREEFDHRLIRCTIDGRGYPMFAAAPPAAGTDRESAEEGGDHV